MRRYSAAKSRRLDELPPARLSLRQRGRAPDLRENTVQLEEAPVPIPKPLRPIFVNLADLPAHMPPQIYLPLTLASIGVTILELGSLMTDPKLRPAYWSKKGVRIPLSI